MKVPTLLLSLAVLTISLASSTAGQGNVLGRNNPYSPSPSGKIATVRPTARKEQPSPTPSRVAPQQVAFVTKDNRSISREENTRVVAKAFEMPSRPGTGLYRIGVGDVVFINLTNSPQGSGYYTVRDNGEIDYPLAGPIVLIGNKTTDEVAALLRSAIKLFPNPQLEVRVQYYLSRSFKVEGLANNAGEKVLRREAMPIFAIRAECEVRREATTVRITRAASMTVESYALSDATTDNVLILAGDRIEFIEERKAEAAQITFAGISKPLMPGTRLSQIVTEALGQKSEHKKVMIRRVGDKGAVTVSEYDINSIKKGNITDPLILSGDVIEVKD